MATNLICLVKGHVWSGSSYIDGNSPRKKDYFTFRCSQCDIVCYVKYGYGQPAKNYIREGEIVPGTSS